MPILPPASPSDTPGHRAAALWHDDHPDRLALGALLPADHLARRIDAAVARLDLAPLYAAYAGTGSLPHDPALLLRAVLFATQRGQHSPAAWHRDAAESGPVRWLLRGLRPARSCWYAFRDRLGPLLPALNAQPLHAAVAAGLTPATRAAADGTLAAANASRHRLLNEATLDKRLEQLAQACAADAGVGAAAPVPGWMAKTAAGRSRQQRRFRLARQQLQAAQARNARKRASKRKPRSRVRISPGDPEAPLGLDKENVYRPLYNVQLVDDLDSPFILGYEVFAQPNDAGLLGSVLTRVQALVGHPLETLLADTAYVGGADLKVAADAHVTVYGPLPAAATQTKQLPKSAFRWEAATQSYVCPQGHRLEAAGSSKQQRSGVETVVLHCYRCSPVHCSACPLRAHCTRNPQAGRTISRSEHEELIEALRLRMETPEAKALYKLRRQTVELVNADWKEHRKLRRCSGRGLARVRCQAGLVVLAHNLLTLLQEEKKAKTAAAAAASPGEIAT